MLRVHPPPNLNLMGAAASSSSAADQQLRTALIRQIEGADADFVRLVSAVVRTLATELTVDILEEDREWTDEEIIAMPPPPRAKPMTREESVADLRQAIAECERGDFITAEELEKEMNTW